MRAWRTGAAALVAALAASGWAGEGEARYRADVEFLLKELEARAGHFFETKGVDWRAVTREFREAVRSVRTDQEHLVLCQRLVARLRDGHAGLVDSKVAWPEDPDAANWGGPGVQLALVGKEVHVKSAWSNAADAGVRAGDRVVTIDGRPAREWLDAKVAEMRDRSGYSTEHQAHYAACHWGLGGPQGSKMVFGIAGRSRSKPRDVEVVRGRASTVPTGPVFPPKGLEQTGRQSYGRTESGYAYIHLRDVPGELPEQLDAMLAAVGDAPGLILDLRANGGGGCDHEAVFGRFVGPDRPFGRYAPQGPSPFLGPMVVIVDPGVRSAGETVAGMLKEDGRAYVIGEAPTAGMSSQKEKLPVPSGLFAAYFSVHSNKARFNGGAGIEGIGVPPHELVPHDPEDLAAGVDTQIARAEELLRKGLPKGKVLWKPPKGR